MNEIKTIKATAAEIGISPVTVSDLVVRLGINPKPMINGNAKGLDGNDRALIEQALRPQQLAAVSA